MLEAITDAFAQTGLQLLAALLISGYSLYLVSKQAQLNRPFLHRKLVIEIDEMLVRFQGNIIYVVRVCLKCVVLIFSLKRRSTLGWADIAVSVGVFGLAIPTFLDVLAGGIQLAREVLRMR